MSALVQAVQLVLLLQLQCRARSPLLYGSKLQGAYGPRVKEQYGLGHIQPIFVQVFFGVHALFALPGSERNLVMVRSSNVAVEQGTTLYAPPNPFHLLCLADLLEHRVPHLANIALQLLCRNGIYDV